MQANIFLLLVCTLYADQYKLFKKHVILISFGYFLLAIKVIKKF